MFELEKPARVVSHGGARYFRTPSGVRVFVLPGHSVPSEHFMEENWDSSKIANRGRTRGVRHVTGLKDGTPVNLVAKEPERVFQLMQLNPAGNWAYERGNPYRQTIPHGRLNHPVVEAMVDMEARILIGLLRADKKAERPLAIVHRPDGRRELIVQAESGPFTHDPEKLAAWNADIREFARREGIHPVDFENNALRDESGEYFVSDVNRWKWPKVTDRYYRALREALREEIRRRR